MQLIALYLFDLLRILSIELLPCLDWLSYHLLMLDSFSIPYPPFGI
ncbi:hypothetical protein VIBNISFn118_1740002 [Vibrio nigripulchritudo SFn118]|nr:hypothetical protein VIBNISFn118_1740002 [Vibrio nigripulchritudo SFn118]